MEQTFDSILSDILKSIENQPEENIDQILAGKLAEAGVSSEGQELLEATNETIEAFEKKKASLRKAQTEGSSRQAWMQEQLHSMVAEQNLAEEEKDKLIAGIAEEYNSAFKNFIEKGE